MRSGWLLLGLLILGCAPIGLPAQPGATPLPAGKVLWPAPANPLELAVAAGLTPDRKETLTNHVHSHLDVYLDGSRVVVPAGIGINVADPGVKTFDFAGSAAYGRIAGCNRPCISPLHTHDQSGVIHIEQANTTQHRLGQFFTEWGVKLSASCAAEFCQPDKTIAVFVDGKKHSGDPAAILLGDHLEIAVLVGAPPARIPSAWPSDAPG